MQQFVPLCVQIKGGHLECFINGMVTGKNNLNKQDEIVSPKYHKIKVMATLRVVYDQNTHKMAHFIPSSMQINGSHLGLYINIRVI